MLVLGIFERKVIFRTLAGIMIPIILLACANMAGAQWSSYQSQPQYRGGTTDCNNANGSSAGRSTTMGNTTYYYNANGSSAGTATKIGK